MVVQAAFDSRDQSRGAPSTGGLKFAGLAALPLLVNVPGLREVPAWSVVIVAFVAGVFLWQHVVSSLGATNHRRGKWAQAHDGTQIRAPVVLLLLVVVSGYVQAVFRGAFGPFNWITQCLSVVGIAVLAGACVGGGTTNNIKPPWMTPFLVGAALFIVINMALLALGVGSSHQSFETAAENRILRLVGLSVSRMAFPISGGQNATAIVGVLILAVALGKLANAETSAPRFGVWVVILLCVASVFLTDARGGYLGILGLTTAYISRRRPKVIVGLFIASASLSFMPIIVKFIAAWLPVRLIFDLFGAQIPRSFDAVGALTTGRNFIWESAFQNLVANPVTLLFGYGVNGHFTSGVSLEYGWLFGGNPWHTLHSWVLQGVFEFGLLGLTVHLGVFFWICVVVLRMHSRALADGYFDGNALACTFVMLGFVICGANESVLSSSFPDHYIFYGICLSYAMRATTRQRLKPRLKGGVALL